MDVYYTRELAKELCQAVTHKASEENSNCVIMDKMTDGTEKAPFNMEKMDGEVRIEGQKPGWFVSRTKAAIIGTTGLCILILVALLVGLIARRNCLNDRSNAPTGNSTQFPKIAAVPTIDPKLPWAKIRLPGDVIPSYYSLHLKIDLRDFVFTGSVGINVTVIKSTQHIIFHIADLDVDKSQVSVRTRGPGPYQQVFSIDDQFEVKLRQFYVIKLSETLKPGQELVVTVGKFDGNISASLRGIYLSKYHTKTGDARYLMASQLQPTDARRVFPCFDEPAMKAVFSISITHRQGYTALSNMPAIKNTTLPGGWHKVNFDDTPIMSSYILAFFVSDFTFRQGETNFGLKIRVWAQPSMYNQSQYGLTTATKCYEFFTQFFDVKEIVPKSDQVAVPDFGAGAMENWGLVIYRQTALLFDPDVSALDNQYFVTFVIAHEIAHTWFGNMVTMKWWDDLWLNEGFASTLMYFALNAIDPEWNVFDLQLTDGIFEVMTKDSLLTSHPISTPIADPDEIPQNFDSISYDKGLAVLRLLRGFIGADKFQMGLQNYIKKYKFKNAEMIDLWRAFQKVSEVQYEIADIMDTWTRQMGFPVVNVKREGPNVVRLEQERFLLNPEGKYDAKESPYGYKWYIPFTYKTQDNGKIRTQWMVMGPATIYVPGDAWIIGNIDCIGFYRVNYETDMWHKHIAQLKRNHKVFSQGNRAGLINDAFNLARASKLSYSLALNLSSYLAKEEQFVPWKAFLNSITFIEGMLSRSEIYGQFSRFMRKLVAPQYDRLGVTVTGTLPERKLRIAILETACRLGVPEAVSYAQKTFEKWMKDGSKVPPDYASTIYSTGIQQGGLEEWDFLWNKSQQTNVASERETMMKALGYTREPWLLWRYANWCFDTDIIRKQDIRLVFSYLSATALGRSISITFMLTKWKELNEQFGDDNFVLRSVISHSTSKLNTEYERKQVKDLFRNQPPDGKAVKEAENAIALMKSNIKWMDTNYKTIADWLEKRTPFAT